MEFKSFSMIFIFYSLIHILLSNAALSKDLGVHGHTYQIEEPDIIAEIKSKLAGLEQSGELDSHNKRIASKVVKSIKTPKSVEGITNTVEARTYIHDPSLIIKQDIKDHLGNVIAKEGDVVNPLDKISLSQNLLFIDGNDDKQIDWVKKEQGKVILTSGSPTKVSEMLDRMVFFDQMGILTGKLKIQQVPARVSQDDKKLLIEEVMLEDDNVS